MAQTPFQRNFHFNIIHIGSKNFFTQNDSLPTECDIHIFTVSFKMCLELRYLYHQIDF